MRIFGYIVAGLLAVGAVAYYTGYVNGDAHAQLTPKGKQAVTSALNNVRQGVSDGLQHAASAVNGDKSSK